MIHVVPYPVSEKRLHAEVILTMIEVMKESRFRKPDEMKCVKGMRSKGVMKVACSNEKEGEGEANESFEDVLETK